MEFSEVAGELLLVAPGDFVRARTAKQREVRGTDRALATRIGGLRKPAPAAWIVDLLAHDGALDDAIDLGPALREAQAAADPHEIGRLRGQRAALVRALTADGAERAEAAGHHASPAVLDQVAATIEAAMMDPHAGAAVRSGLLVRPLESVGFDAVDLDGALADPDAVPEAWSGSDAPPVPISSARSRRRRGTPDGGSGAETTRASRAARRSGAAATAEHADAGPSRQELRAAETDARRTSRAADAALDAAESALQDLDDERAGLEERRTALQRELREVEQRITALDDDRESAEQRRDEAEAASDRARRGLDEARERLRSLHRP
uniref:Uncharacterized protein n=1 Tax=Neobacillus citreus TaxID=2833578 RepID=A0A942SYD1_9BACI